MEPLSEEKTCYILTVVLRESPVGWIRFVQNAESGDGSMLLQFVSNGADKKGPKGYEVF